MDKNDFEGDMHSEDQFSDDDENEIDLDSAFWAENIGSNGKLEIDTIQRQITLTSVALSGSKAETTLYVKVSDTKYTLCTLSGACPQFRLNLTFGSSETPVEFGVTGAGSVTLLGEQRIMFTSDELNFDSDEEGMEVEEEDEVVQKPQGGKGQPKKEETQAQQQSKKGKPQEQGKGQQQPKKEGNQAQGQKKGNQEQGKGQQQPKKEGNSAQNQPKKEQQPQQENGSKNKKKKNNNNNNATPEATKTEAVTPKAKTEEKQGTPSAKRANPPSQNGEQTGTKKQKTNEQKANE